jgi:hypothetical protein
MATFEEQIEALTSIDLTSSTSPKNTEVSQFLADGVKDLVSRVADGKPQDLHLFARTQDGSITSDGFRVGSGILVNVWRADGSTEDNLHQANQINAGLRYRATDESSMHYRDKQHPAFFWENDKVYVLPSPSGTTTDKAVVSYIDYDLDPLYTDDEILYIPEEYERLVVVYAAMKVIESHMADLVLTEEDIELSSGMQTNLAMLSKQYDGAFGTKAAPEERAAAR